MAIKSENGQYKNINNIDENYFNKIDTSEKAWLLGLFAADGSVKKHNKGITISQSGDDGFKIIQHIKNILRISNKICTTKTSCNDSHSIGANCSKIAKDLSRFNITPNKTYSFTFPDLLPIEFLRDFIRGYIDGDGSVGIYNNGAGIISLHISFVGTHQFISKCSQLIPIKNGKIHIHHCSDKISEIKWTGKTAIKFCEWLYSNESLYKYYKYNKYKEYMEYFKHNPPKYILYNTRKEKALQLYKTGLNGVQIGKELNIPFQTIYKWIRKFHEY